MSPFSPPVVIPRPQFRPRVVLRVAVDFTARCPGCGEDAEWRQERSDRRSGRDETVTHVTCGCGPA